MKSLYNYDSTCEICKKNVSEENSAAYIIRDFKNLLNIYISTTWNKVRINIIATFNQPWNVLTISHVNVMRYIKVINIQDYIGLKSFFL